MQFYFFCYHKGGSVLCGRIARRLAEKFGLACVSVPGLVTRVNRAKHFITFQHSLINFDLAAHPHKGVRLIRDPRDVWVSGYLYHRHCREPWCTNQAFDLAPPIMFPRVPYSQQHRSESWKQAYIAGLGGMSYQQNLLARDDDSGLSFEMERYTDWTISAMLAWQPDPDTIEVKLEEFMADFDGVLGRMLRHFGFSDTEVSAGLSAVSPEDLNRMSDEALAQNSHIHGRSISKWRGVLTKQQQGRFEAKYGAALEKLGYSAG